MISDDVERFWKVLEKTIRMLQESNCLIVGVDNLLEDFGRFWEILEDLGGKVLGSLSSILYGLDMFGRFWRFLGCFWVEFGWILEDFGGKWLAGLRVDAVSFWKILAGKIVGYFRIMIGTITKQV